ncbi:MAG: hypothetical protein A2X61_12030 [Ignavibacteria bacterium GWB2_35_12]|nr:MAG: hypothetical protein A2X63_05870 [Ignavibacteria bacterium GWA2_35_8]OGU41987.1 MAG: hypothetical protein A2X61_12030 [Ignavibacteria bacterium GWB2_35_12]OGV24419.1 MAG: hypothetical protein A2475_12570 [Ignavibacteria bacterium RIFOXYC2_FULL_35_21]
MAVKTPLIPTSTSSVQALRKKGAIIIIKWQSIPVSADTARHYLAKNKRCKNKDVGVICQENGFKRILKWFKKKFKTILINFFGNCTYKIL